MDKPFPIEFKREADEPWFAKAIDLPGVLAYGASKEEARINIEALARQIIDERQLEAER